MEEQHIVKILSVEPDTHDVKRFRVEKPAGYAFIPGQATEVTINKEGWLDKRNPFTFTSLNTWDSLEFTIKIYDEHQEVTHQLGLFEPGDELILHDVWGAIGRAIRFQRTDCRSKIIPIAIRPIYTYRKNAVPSI